MDVRKINVTGNGTVFEGWKTGNQAWIFRESGSFVINFDVDPSFTGNYVEIYSSIGGFLFPNKIWCGGVQVRIRITSFASMGILSVNWRDL